MYIYCYSINIYLYLLHKQTKMKTKTETILTISKFLALMGGVWYCVLCTGQIVTLVASFTNLEWAKHSYQADLTLFSVRDQSTVYFVSAMCLTIAVAGLKAKIWYVVYQLLSKLKLHTPFSMEVEKKLELIAYLLLAVWLLSTIFWKTLIFYVSRDTSIHLAINNNGDEYLFMAAMMYIISQVFKRGIEIQEENQLTV